MIRLINRPLAFLLAAALLVGGVLVVIEVIAYAINSTHVLINWPTWSDWAHRTKWNRAVIKTWSIVLAVLGLLLLIVELRRPTVRRIALTSDDAGTDAAITRRGLTGTLRDAATDVDGVSKATVTLTRSKATVEATSGGRGCDAADTLTEPVTAAVQTRLDQLGLAKPVRLRVSTRPSGSS